MNKQNNKRNYSRIAEVIVSEICECGEENCDRLQENYTSCPKCGVLLSDNNGGYELISKKIEDSNLEAGDIIKCQSCGVVIKMKGGE